MAHPSVDSKLIKGKQFKQELKKLGVTIQDEPIYYFSYIVPRVIKILESTNVEYYFFVQQPGETLFVPYGWWHAVLNIDDTIAYTQNLATDYSLYNNLKNMW